MENPIIHDDSLSYLHLQEGDFSDTKIHYELQKLNLNKKSFPNSYFTFSKDIFTFYKHTQAVLGHWSPDIEYAKKNNMRYESYEKMSQMHFASSTIGLPGKPGARVARGVCEKLAQIMRSEKSDSKKLHEIEVLVSSISKRAFESICQYYSLSNQNCEMFFDDNATMALYQFMSYLPLRRYDTTLTLFDTGRVIPPALRGTNPEYKSDNFRPVIDIFGNWTRMNKLGINKNIDQLIVFSIEHFIDGKHTTDKELLKDILYIVNQSKPKILLIPTVTRLGRKLDFLNICKMVKETIANSTSQDYDPWIILDDAQGVLRLSSKHYKENSKDSWESYDAILQTGAKVAGALLGSGAIVFNKDKFVREQCDFSASKMVYRSRKYSFVSSNNTRMKHFNQTANGVLNAPEVASLIIQLEKVIYNEEVDKRMQYCRKLIESTLHNFPNHIRILHSEEDVEYVNSIIGFYFKKLTNVSVPFKQKLGNPKNGDSKIILPALVTPENDQDPVDHYLRVSFDPNEVKNEKKYREYIRKIECLSARIKDTIWDLICISKPHEGK